MDDTSFFYSRTLRLIAALAIIIPLLGIGIIIWYFASDVPVDTSQEHTGLQPVETTAEAEQPNMDAGEPEEVSETSLNEEVAKAVASATTPGENPLRPIGPPASERLPATCGTCVG